MIQGRGRISLGYEGFPASSVQTRDVLMITWIDRMRYLSTSGIRAEMDNFLRSDNYAVAINDEVIIDGIYHLGTKV